MSESQSFTEQLREAFQRWQGDGPPFPPLLEAITTAHEAAIKEARLRELKALLDPTQEYVEKSTVLARIAELGELNK